MNNVKDFGATGDGFTNDSAAVQKAIDAGGVVWFPQGIYRCGTLYLKSGGGLRLDDGAIILASRDTADYNQPNYCSQNRPSLKEHASGRHLISAVEVNDVFIEGGTIDGEGMFWMKEKHAFQPVYLPNPERLSQLVFFCECRGVTIRNCRFQHASYWHCLLHGCENVEIDRLTVAGEPMILNDDGIDIDCCKNVRVTNCCIVTGDDAIAVRGDSEPLKQYRECEDIKITNCQLSSAYACAVRIGVGDGKVANCSFENLEIYHAKVGICMVAKFDNGANEGTRISNVAFTDVKMNAKRSFLINLDNHYVVPERKSASVFENLTFSRISGCAELTSIIEGNGVGTVKDLKFSDITLAFLGKGDALPNDENGFWCVDSSDAMFEFKQVEKLQFENVRLHGNDNWKYEIRDLGVCELSGLNPKWRIDRKVE